MKNTILIFGLILFLNGCSMTSNHFLLKKYELKNYLQNKNDFGTPMDNIYDAKLTCFEKISGDKFKESHNIQASQSIGQPIIFQSSFNINTPNSQKKVTKKEAEKGLLGEHIQNNDLSFGDFFEFYLGEDLNGEYIANISYSKKELKKLTVAGIDELNVVSTILIEQEYYPTNKLPYKIFENKEGTDLCYVTVKW